VAVRHPSTSNQHVNTLLTKLGIAAHAIERFPTGFSGRLIRAR
jgi:hypothetical protein